MEAGATFGERVEAGATFGERVWCSAVMEGIFLLGGVEEDILSFRVIPLMNLSLLLLPPDEACLETIQSQAGGVWLGRRFEEEEEQVDKVWDSSISSFACALVQILHPPSLVLCNSTPILSSTNMSCLFSFMTVDKAFENLEEEDE
jgi:hypothetical protein